jgi:hypothetical protein
MRFNVNWSQIASLGLLGASLVRSAELSKQTQALFDQSMTILDDIYDPTVSYLHNFYFPLAAGPHDTRSTVWYSVGLLQRNQGNDLKEAVKILKNVIAGQEKNMSAQWYGDYTVYPEQPTVGNPAYAPDVSSYPCKPHLRPSSENS